MSLTKQSHGELVSSTDQFALVHFMKGFRSGLARFALSPLTKTKAFEREPTLEDIKIA